MTLQQLEPWFEYSISVFVIYKSFALLSARKLDEIELHSDRGISIKRQFFSINSMMRILISFPLKSTTKLGVFLLIEHPNK